MSGETAKPGRPERPAFVQVPIAGGGSMTAVVATRDGIAEVDLNGVPHIGLMLSVNQASATLAVLTPDEAAGVGGRLSLAALVLAKRWRRMGVKPTGERRLRRDLSQATDVREIHASDLGSNLFEVLDGEGKRVEQVIEANADEGWVVRYATDEAGHAMLADDEFITERVEMPVTIRRLS